MMWVLLGEQVNTTSRYDSLGITKNESQTEGYHKKPLNLNFWTGIRGFIYIDMKTQNVL